MQNPQKHDKAEFEIVFSCYTLDMPQRIQVLKEYGFSDEEISRIVDALRDVTNHIIDYKNGLWRKDYRKIEILNERYQKVMESGLNDIEKIYWLLEDCRYIDIQKIYDLYTSTGDGKFFILHTTGKEKIQNDTGYYASAVYS